MSLEQLSAIIASGIPQDVGRDQLAEHTRQAIEVLFGSRYAQRSERSIRSDSLRSSGDMIPFAGIIHPDNPTSGVYGGMSLVWFPVPEADDHPAGSLLTLVCGTRGLAPDEPILSRPGHARHLQSLRRYLAQACGAHVWVKPDPTNLAQAFPRVTREQWPQYKDCIQRYGSCIYAAVSVPHDAPEAAQTVVTAFLDFYGWERAWTPLKAAQEEVENLKSNLRESLFPRLDLQSLYGLLLERHFVILQGPPGTGKTRMADQMLRSSFQGHGMSVQFHPAVTYETFVAGIAPAVEEQILRFDIKPGWLVQAVEAAQQTDQPYLLHIDEINRADLGRVLGEAICLFEPREIAQGNPRTVQLPQPLNGRSTLTIPPNLYILGTMNSADRSIAILDLAVRRRFAFVDLWPDAGVVAEQSRRLSTEAFSHLQDIFAQYAPDDGLVLLPGHAYFLADTDDELRHRLQYELIPLLREYLQEGRLGPCESELQAYLDWLEGELAQHVAQG